MRRQLASEEARLCNAALELSVMRGMLAVAQAELGDLEERLVREGREEHTALIEQKRGYKQRLEMHGAAGPARAAAAPPAPVSSTAAPFGANPSQGTAGGTAGAAEADGALVLVINLKRRSDR